MYHVKIKIQNEQPVKTEYYTNLLFTETNFTPQFSKYTNTSTEPVSNIYNYTNTFYLNPNNFLIKVQKPVITTNLSQLHLIAGLDTLTIEGNYFGTEKGEVWFKNTEEGGLLFIEELDSSFVVNWTDTLIKVRVPSYIPYENKNACASTGKVRIKTSIGRKGTSSTELNVDYSLTTHGQLPDYPIKRVYLAKLDCNNDVMFTLHENIMDIDSAAICIEQVLKDWSKHTGINLILEKDTNGNFVTIDTLGAKKNVIYFKPERDYGMATFRAFKPNIDFNNNNEISYYREYTDIEIAPEALIGVAWNYKTSGSIPSRKVSFYQAFLHEVGHFLGLGHVSDTTGLMYYTISEAITSRPIIDLNTLTISKPDTAAMRVITDSKKIKWFGESIGTFGIANPSKPIIQASGDLISCLDSLTLTSDYNSGNTWFPNREKTNFINVKLNGKYAVTVLNNACTVTSDTVSVKLRPQITSFMINNGAKGTGSTKVTLDNTSINQPIYYNAIEVGSTATGWLPYSTSPYFYLSKKTGTIKQVQLQIKYNDCISDTKTASIMYSPYKSGTKHTYSNSDNINVYPNPVIDNIIIEYYANNSVQLEIVNSLGNVVYKNYFQDKIEVNVSDYEAGIYFIKIIDDEIIHSKKLLKK